MVHVIAEAGSNYNGSVEMAKSLSLIAKRAGADSVKFQIINPGGLYLPGQYSYGWYDIKQVMSIRQANVLSLEQWREIRLHAKSIDLGFGASIFDEKGLECLMELQPDYIKVASTDLNNHLLLRKVAKAGLPVIISTGMSTLQEIRRSLEVVREGKGDANAVVVLHCVSAYPTELRDTNLRFMDELASLGYQVGFSDHTLGNIAACIAVARGAGWIEKHFTADKTLPGFDHKHALDFEELTNYVDSVRDAEAAVAPAGQKIGTEELNTMKRARRGVYAASDLSEGHTIRESDLLVVRPPSAISADQAENLIGKVLRMPMKRHEAFSSNLVF